MVSNVRTSSVSLPFSTIRAHATHRALMDVEAGTTLVHQLHGGVGSPRGGNRVSVLRSLAALGNNSVCAWDPGSDSSTGS